MCGIAGFSGQEASEVSDAVLEVLGHRGPDGRGRYNSACGTVSLFHTRLAILDPTPDGAQPMSAADGQVVITFNGEIYNFWELRADLENKGYRFRTRTDTETILALYLEYGPELLQRLNGIYAFAIWDARDRVLFVARDQLGVKPLYISEAANTFAFASEIKVFLHMPWVPRTVDPEALEHYLRFLWCPAPRTPLQHVKKLEAGHALIVRDGHVVRRWQHYQLPAPGPDEHLSLQDWIREVRRSLAKAVQRQMVSDVPLGAFLSGGLDSSAIVAYAREFAKGRLQCFTIDFEEEQARQEGLCRDLPYALRVAQHLDVDLHVVRVGSEMADELPQMIWHLDEPQADFASVNVLLISRLARQHGIKVLLSGAGGDDLFTGYRRHLALRLDTLWDKSPRPLRSAARLAAERLPTRPPVLRRLAKLLAGASLQGDNRIASYFHWATTVTVHRLFASDVAATLQEEPLLAALASMPVTATPLQRMLLLEQRFFLADHNLNYTDKMSMAVGVESRVPFLDSEVVALAARIPDRYRMHGSEGKWILKRAMDGILPREAIYRPKTGFGVPLRSWLRGPLKSFMLDLLSPETLRKRGIFDAHAVVKMIDDNENGRGDYAYTIFGLMCIELWCRSFADAHFAACSGPTYEVVSNA